MEGVAERCPDGMLPVPADACPQPPPARPRNPFDPPAALALILGLLACVLPTAAHGWSRVVVDSVGDVGEYPSLVLDSQSLPHIAYYDFDHQDLKYTYLSGGSWITVLVDTVGDVGQYASLALDNLDRPIISYYDATHQDLKVASLTGSSWTIQTVDATGVVGSFTSIAVAPNGTVAVSYFDQTNSDLKLATRFSFSWSIETVDASGSVGSRSSLTFDSSSNPHISYRGITTSDVKYATRTGGPWLIETVEGAASVGLFTSIRVDAGGVPSIAYFDITNSALKYASRAGGVWTTSFVDSAGFVGTYCSLALDSLGQPHIAYVYGDVPNADLRVASRSGTNWTVTSVDTLGDIGYWPSLTIAPGGCLRLAYYDNTHLDLIFGDQCFGIGPCGPTSTWKAGPSIKLVRPLDYWPKGQSLKGMRPGDVIAFSVYATDADYVLQTCTDCLNHTLTKKWGPYADRVIYQWDLSGDPYVGKWYRPQIPEDNSALFQIPLNWGQYDEAHKVAGPYSLVITNHLLEKALDDVIAYAFTIFMDKNCDATGNTPGGIDVHITMSGGEVPADEPVVEGGSGTCIPQPPVWVVGTPLTKGPIVMTEAPHLCPDYLALLSVAAIDSDMVTLACNDPTNVCTPAALPPERPPDAVRSSWGVVSGPGSFPLGTEGSVVVFWRSKSDSTRIQCLTQDSQTQFTDGSQTDARTMLKSKPPKALVGNGDDTLLGYHFKDAIKTADIAESRFKAQGYEVDFNPAVLNTDIRSALQTSCYQAIWLVGHGGDGIIYTADEPPNLPLFNTDAFSGDCLPAWDAPFSPFIRELTLLGCDTYAQQWRNMLVCGVVHDFDYLLYNGRPGRYLGRNPATWERRNHKPPAPHNLSAP
jgi:hypothetical protein